MRPIPAVLMAALAVAGCAAQAAPDQVPVQEAASTTAPMSTPSNSELANLDDSQWRFVELDGVPVPQGINATLLLRNGRASGKAGCNAYGARYHVAADGTAGFTQTLSTKMACLEPAGVMRVERGVFNAFKHATKLEVAAGELVMLDAAGKPLAKLQRQTP